MVCEILPFVILDALAYPWNYYFPLLGYVNRWMKNKLYQLNVLLHTVRWQLIQQRYQTKTACVNITNYFPRCCIQRPCILTICEGHCEWRAAAAFEDKRSLQVAKFASQFLLFPATAHILNTVTLFDYHTVNFACNYNTRVFKSKSHQLFVQLPVNKKHVQLRRSNIHIRSPVFSIDRYCRTTPLRRPLGECH